MIVTPQSFNEAQANYYRLKVNFFAKLSKRVDNGTLTQNYYDQQLALFQDDLQNPDNILSSASDFSLSDFMAAIANRAAELVGKVVGGGIDGGVRGLFGSFSFGTWLLLAVLLAILFWAFTKGPLRNPV